VVGLYMSYELETVVLPAHATSPNFNRLAVNT